MLVLQVQAIDAGLYFSFLPVVLMDQSITAIHSDELTLTLQLLTDLWSQLSQLEKVYLLRKVGKIQANPDKAPSDCSMFLSNMTLRLFVRISIYYKLPRSKKKQKVYEDFLLAVAKKGIYQRKSS
jgi:hypothetical protein